MSELQTALNSDFKAIRKLMLTLMLTGSIPVWPIAQRAVLAPIGCVVHNLDIGTVLTDPATSCRLSLLNLNIVAVAVRLY